jgi:DNA mismatch repair protein MutL
LRPLFQSTPLGKIPDSGEGSILVNKTTGEIIGHKSEQNFDYRPPNSFERPSGAEISAFDSLFTQNPSQKESVENHDGGRIISIFGKYILAEYPERLLIINRAAAQRRIIYERLLNSWENNAVKSQEMLFPEKIEIDSGIITKAKENKEILSAGGFDFEIKDNAIFLNAVPAVVTDGKEKGIFEEIVSELPENRNPDSRKAVEMAFIIISRAGANALSAKLTPNEQSRLVQDLMNCRINNICPEGGRIIKRLSRQDFDNFFNKT